MKLQLSKYLQRYISLTPEEFEDFFSKMEHKTFEKKEHLLKEGQVCRYNYFIVKGLLRCYYIDNKATEKITQFAIENWWVSQMESFLYQSPSNLSIQALEATEVLRISKENLDQLFVQIPKIERLFRIITQQMLVALQRRYDFYLKKTSRERYENLVTLLPDFVQRVPQYMLASYLEITPEYLSEIRKS